MCLRCPTLIELPQLFSTVQTRPSQPAAGSVSADSSSQVSIPWREANCMPSTPAVARCMSTTSVCSSALKQTKLDPTLRDCLGSTALKLWSSWRKNQKRSANIVRSPEPLQVAAGSTARCRHTSPAGWRSGQRSSSMATCGFTAGES